ncbi:porin family protein [Williamwhitmania taraxaci]|uniref:Outer membrane protein beta-barrel domain-containing protein n=1 Tax=Williamwhitmania taraxaci TaxID=1640674 RepID=A0A1G6GVQ3_9BACT|nr:porin family protein [Williamwhitmania taraxaci]SDB86034.1 Outer membrane protein beta-barrel domain-containing protein [Williamwhitmania taraxaci]
MKKTILLFVVATVIGGTLKAQDELHFGLKIGTNLSNVYDTKGEEFDADSKFGFVAGAFFSIPIGSFLGVQPEVLFSQKGFQATGKILGSDYKFTRTLNYIDVPLLVALKPIPMVTILAGPQYSYLIKEKVEFSGSTSSSNENDIENDNIRKNTLCFLGGLDLNFETIVIGARAGWDLYNNNGDGTSTTPRYKNVWYQATIGFRF